MWTLAVPKNRAPEFLDLIEDLANDTCVEGDPECHRCELRKICAFALTHKLAAADSAPSGRTAKSRPPKEKDKDAAKAPKAKQAETTTTPTPSLTKKSTPVRAAKETPQPPKQARGKHGT